MNKPKTYTEEEVIKIIKSLREDLSDLEHQQWMSWSHHVANNNKIPKELLDKWVLNWIPYSKLSEKTKDSDRIWADKIISRILQEFMTPAGFRSAIEKSNLVGTKFGGTHREN